MVFRIRKVYGHPFLIETWEASAAQPSADMHAPAVGWIAHRLGVSQFPLAARSFVPKLIPVSNSKVLLLLKSMDKHNEEVLVVE